MKPRLACHEQSDDVRLVYDPLAWFLQFLRVRLLFSSNLLLPRNQPLVKNLLDCHEQEYDDRLAYDPVAWFPPSLGV